MEVSRKALKISLTRPRFAYFSFQTIRNQKKAAQLRLEWEKKNIHVPPFMIVSVTKRCNLRCKGCYMRAQNRSSDSELTADRLKALMQEASELGISFVVFLGGEPLLRPEILDITEGFKHIIFPVFTNGLLIDDSIIGKLKRQKNVIAVISIEGHTKETDQRRGEGVSRGVYRAMDKLKDLFFAVSITMTKKNFDVVTSDHFIQSLLNKGCSLFFFVEYIPIEKGTEELVISDEQKRRLSSLMKGFRDRYNGLFVDFPGDEEEFGGCLSSGRGFLHISPEGNLEPCPLAPFSDTNINNVSLKEALNSEFLKKIRESSEHLSEAEGGCALWNNRDWTLSLLEPR